MHKQKSNPTSKTLPVHIKQCLPAENIVLPEIRNRLPASSSTQKPTHAPGLKLPLINSKENKSHKKIPSSEQTDTNFSELDVHNAKAFQVEIQGKMREVLAGINVQMPAEGYGTYLNEDIEHEAEVMDHREQNAKNFMKKKSCRDVENATVEQKQSSQKSIQLQKKQPVPKGSQEPKHFIKPSPNQEELSKDFALQMQNQMKKILHNLNDDMPEKGFGTFKDDELDFQYKIKQNKIEIHQDMMRKLKQQGLGEKLRVKLQAGQYNKIENVGRPKSSQNDSMSKKDDSKAAELDRPQSSKNNQHHQKMTKQNEPANNRKLSKSKAKSTKKIVFSSQNKQYFSNQQPKQLENVGIVKSPAAKLAKLPYLPPKQSSSKKIKQQITVAKNKSFKIRGKSEKRIGQKYTSMELIPMEPQIKTEKVIPHEKDEREPLVLGRKSSQHVPTVLDEVLKARREKNCNQEQDYSLEQLQNMKKQLQQRIRTARQQLGESILVDRQKDDAQIRMRFSARDWKKVQINGHEIECEISNFDQELNRIQQLEKKSSDVLSDYLQHRIMLMDLNCHHKSEQIRNEVRF